MVLKTDTPVKYFDHIYLIYPKSSDIAIWHHQLLALLAMLMKVKRIESTRNVKHGSGIDSLEKIVLVKRGNR